MTVTLLTFGSAAGANACGSGGDGVFDGERGSGGAVGAGLDAGSTGGERTVHRDPVGASGVACASQGDCGEPWPYCDESGGECVQCLTDTNCVDGRCDAATHSCVDGDPPTSDPVAPTGLGGVGFPGAGGFSGAPLQPGFGPSTADDCPALATAGGDVTQTRDGATLCFYGDEPTPAATIEQVIEAVGDDEYIHLRVTFDPTFADNTYGEGSVGWEGTKEGTREFGKLVGSDHVELLLTDCSGATVMQFRVDYVSEDPDSASGYGTLGVTGGDGRMEIGDASDVLAVATSIDRNLNGCGYSDHVVDSPSTDATFAPNADTPNWDYRVVYEVWVDAAAFEQCFGQAYIEVVHASPAKGEENTITVEGGPCPPEWDTPYCTSDGEGCTSSTPDGGAPCPQNETPYEACPTECVPIPFAGYADRAACPDGWVLDLASEGRYCVPVEEAVCP